MGTSGWLRGVEIVYGQHWYWYTTARILTIRESTLFYLPKDWIWSLALSEARSEFSGTGAEWRPGGMTPLGFPIAGRDEHQLAGNVFFPRVQRISRRSIRLGAFLLRPPGAVCATN